MIDTSTIASVEDAYEVIDGLNEVIHSALGDGYAVQLDERLACCPFCGCEVKVVREDAGGYLKHTGKHCVLPTEIRPKKRMANVLNGNVRRMGRDQLADHLLMRLVYKWNDRKGVA